MREYIVSIKVTPGAKAESFFKTPEGYGMKVRKRAADGAANSNCIEYLSQLTGIPKSGISLKSGFRSRFKTFVFRVANGNVPNFPV